MSNIEIFATQESNTLAQLYDVTSRVERAALMADGHLGYVMPIGGVAAYRDKVSVVGVGFDIACGNAAIRTDLTLPKVQGRLRELADEIQASLSFGGGLRNRSDDAPTHDPLFEDPAGGGVKWSWCTTITTSRGSRSTAASSCTSSARAPRRRFRGRRALSVALWATTP